MDKIFKEILSTELLTDNKFFFADGSKSKASNNRLRYISDREKIANCKYVVQYFYLYDIVVIWNRQEHISTTNCFLVKYNDVLDMLESKQDFVVKNVGFSSHGSSKVYVCRLKDLESLLSSLEV